MAANLNKQAETQNAPRIRTNAEIEVTLPALLCQETQSRIVIGRNDVGGIVDIDLTAQGAYRLGVSRQHAMIECREGHWYIQDLNSRNGTKVSEVILMPNVPYEIYNGIEITLGSMALRLYIEN